MGKSIDINIDEMKSLYNQGLSDNEIAKVFGCSRKSISKRRQKLGLSVNFRRAIDKEKEQIIIQMFSEGKSGGEICRTLHLSSSTIAKFKKEHGIQSAFEMKMSAEDIEKAMQMAKEGYMDTEIANMFSVSAGNIMFHRKQRGIKSQFSYDKISKIDNDKFLELFNQGLGDVEIGKQLGMTSDGIYAHRMRHGYLRESQVLAKSKELTDFQKQVLIGTMLGDSSFKVGKDMINPSVSCAHGIAQKEYCEYKAQIFESLGAYAKYHKRNKPDKRNGKFYEDYTMYIPANPELLDWYKTFYPNGKKVIPFELLQYFTEVSLAFLFMDDGSKASTGAVIATNCFSIEEVERFQKFLMDKFGLETSIFKDHQLYIRAKSYRLMKSLIEPYMCECMKYKIR